MSHKFRFAIFPLAVSAILSVVSCGRDFEYVDVFVVGGGASGVSAAVQASRGGAGVVVAEESTWLGGMLTGAGVSAIDGNLRMPAGVFGEFRSELEKHYGGPQALHTGWVSSVLFEPSVGDSIFKAMIERTSPRVNILYSTRLVDASRGADGLWYLTLVDADGRESKYKSRILIDATELGDVAAMVGVGYDIGMESNAVTHEDVAPDDANNIIQDLTMVATLKDYGHDVTIERPEDYDPDEFACTARNPLCVNPKEPHRQWPADYMMEYGHLPNGKYMINWPIEGNDYYVNIIEMTREQRDSAMAEAKAHTLRYIYFLQHELGYNTLGLADDEYPTPDLLPFIPYHRESRRIHGKVRFDLNHIMRPYDTAQPLYRTGIAVGDYPVDHHHKAYSGADSLPNLYFHPVPSYGLALGVIMPDSIDNLLVTEKSISVSNVANGTTRLQPVVMQIGQAAGAVAALALKNDTPTSAVNVRDVQRIILDNGGYLMPYLDVRKDDPRFAAYQRIGASGILRGEGRSIDWSNETWLRADDVLQGSELADFQSFYSLEFEPVDGPVTVSQVRSLLVAAGVETDAVDTAFDELLLDSADDAAVTRGDFAVIVDSLLSPFDVDVDIYGNFIN